MPDPYFHRSFSSGPGALCRAFLRDIRRRFFLRLAFLVDRLRFLVDILRVFLNGGRRLHHARLRPQDRRRAVRVELLRVLAGSSLIPAVPNRTPAAKIPVFFASMHFRHLNISSSVSAAFGGIFLLFVPIARDQCHGQAEYHRPGPESVLFHVPLSSIPGCLCRRRVRRTDRQGSLRALFSPASLCYLLIIGRRSGFSSNFPVDEKFPRLNEKGPAQVLFRFVCLYVVGLVSVI